MVGTPLSEEILCQKKERVRSLLGVGEELTIERLVAQKKRTERDECKAHKKTPSAVY